jgi:hypothetical protein
MKLLLLLRGYHYTINNKGPISWKECYQSLKQNYLDYYKNDEIDCYFLTYESPELPELIQTYKPINYIVYKNKEISSHNQVNNMYNLLNIVLNAHLYDQILFTRFDILYKIPVNMWNIQPSNIMVPFFQPNNTYCDTIYVIPGHLCNYFKNCIQNCNRSNLHDIKFDHIKPMVDNKFYSDTDFPEYFPLNNNPIYKLHRVRFWGFQNREQAKIEAKKQGFLK